MSRLSLFLLLLIAVLAFSACLAPVTSSSAIVEHEASASASEIEWVDAVLLEHSLEEELTMMETESEATPKPKKAKAAPKSNKGALLPGQFCPVSFPGAQAQTAAPGKVAVRGGKKLAGKKAPKATKKSKVNAKKAFLEMETFENVPPLTPEQLAQCAADQAKAAAAAAAAPAAPAKGKGVGGKKFTSLVNGSTNDQIWSPNVSEKVKSAVFDYKSKKKLPNGRVYGEAARAVSLTGKSQQQVEAALNKFACTLDNQVMKNGTTPILDANGKTVPMPTYICPDGSAFRLKPNGDPTSKFRPQPHGVKALRYPYDGPFLTFDDEVIKIDNSKVANPLPKFAADLAVFFPNDKVAQFDATDAWADRAHADLKRI